jgi:hypothetical protein
METLAFFRCFWQQTAVPVFFERYILAFSLRPRYF